jgi:hypothetical protein
MGNSVTDRAATGEPKNGLSCPENLSGCLKSIVSGFRAFSV